MGKKKGRQSGGFASKSMRAAFTTELRDRAQEVPRSSLQSKLPKSTTSSTLPDHRPKLLLNRLRGMLQERQLEDRLQDRNARRRRHQMINAMNQHLNGTPVNSTVVKEEELSNRVQKPAPGWILNYGIDNNSSTRTVPSLETLCLDTLGPSLPDYLEALGRDTLHAMLELLPSSTLAALSVVVSSTVGINNDLAFVIGKHNHVEKLALHSLLSIQQHDDDDDEEHDSSTNHKRGLTDEGILELVPRIVSSNHHFGEEQEEQVLDSWEQMDNDVVEMEGCIRLRRLELVNASTISVETVSTLLSKCSCITHLSLENSLQWNAGHELMLHLPSLLPSLQVLNVSCCSWVTDVLLRAFWRSYRQERLPRVCAIQCVSLSNSVREELLYEFPGCLISSSDTINVEVAATYHQKMEATIDTDEWVDLTLDATH